MQLFVSTAFRIPMFDHGTTSAQAPIQTAPSSHGMANMNSF